jgi:hypothetical protein
MWIGKIITKVTISVICTLFLFACGGNVACAAEEKIDDFEAVIRINADASVDITENIRYDFGEAEKHGIYRYVPVRYAARGGNFSVRLDNINVTDENGRLMNLP